MDRVRARWQSFERKLEQDPGRGLREIDRTDILAALVLQRRFARLGGGRQCQSGRQQSGAGDGS